jgi:prepilin-type N-terminal cleavage/methylation domain-containing protein
VICRIAHTDPMTRRARRAGLSLLEVVVALAILASSIVAIGQLITMSGERATEVEREAQGSMLCQRKLAELLIGPDVPTTSGYAPFPDDEPALQNWQWKADVNPGANGLYFQVQVSVKFASGDGGDGSSVEIELGQMILDPTQRGSNQDPTANTNNTLNAVVQTPSGTGSSSATPAAAAPAAMTPSAMTSTGKTNTPAAATPSTGKTTTPAAAMPSTGKTTTTKGG